MLEDAFANLLRESTQNK